MSGIIRPHDNDSALPRKTWTHTSQTAAAGRCLSKARRVEAGALWGSAVGLPECVSVLSVNIMSVYDGKWKY